MASFLHYLVGGLASGTIYAGMALALVVVYQATHRLNFAQGQMAMFSTYVAWSLIQAGVPYWGAFVLTLAFAFLMGAMIQFHLLRRLADAPPLSIVVVFIGLFVILDSLAGWIFGTTLRVFPSPFPAGAPFGQHYVSAHQLGAVGVNLALMALLYAFFFFTPLGLAMRAAAQNPVASRLVGIRVERLLALGWGLASLVGAVAGMMAAPVVYLDPGMMIGTLLYAFAGALVGGLESPGGAVFGGLLMGVLESLLGAYVIGNELKLSLTLLVIIVIVTVRPAGLFGRARMSRV